MEIDNFLSYHVKVSCWHLCLHCPGSMMVQQYSWLCWGLLLYSLSCVDFCYIGLLFVFHQILHSLWWHLVLLSIFLVLPSFDATQYLFICYLHSLFITVSFLMISVIIWSSLIQLMNCSLNLLSFSLYLHSFVLTPRWPIHSSAFSFTSLIILHYLSDNIVLLCWGSNFSFRTLTALFSSCTFTSHCNLMFGWVWVLHNLASSLLLAPFCFPVYCNYLLEKCFWLQFQRYIVHYTYLVHSNQMLVILALVVLFLHVHWCLLFLLLQIIATVVASATACAMACIIVWSDAIFFTFLHMCSTFVLCVWDCFLWVCLVL